MSKVSVKLWNRDFKIPFSYSCYQNEEVTEIQKAALSEFCEKESPTDGSLAKLKKYVADNSDSAITEEIDNIFKYVMPVSLFVPREATKKVAIICNFKFDAEQGIAVVFENGKVGQIGPQDIIL